MIYNRDIDICRMKTEPRYDIIDSHSHFSGLYTGFGRLSFLVRAMDAAGVSESVVFGMPMAKNGII